MFLINTFANACALKWNQKMFIDDRAGPGGPLGYWMLHYSNFYKVGTDSAAIVNTWLQDGLLVSVFVRLISPSTDLCAQLYRFYIICARNLGYPWLATVPCLLYLSSVGISLVFTFQVSQPQANIWQHSTTDYAVIYCALCVALNVILTGSICVRLIVQRNSLRVGETTADAGQQYFSIAMIIIESASLCSVTQLITAVFIATKSPLQNIALGVLGPAQCIAPLLIIYRIAQGRAYEDELRRQFSSEGTEYSQGSHQKSFSNMTPSYASRRPSRVDSLMLARPTIIPEDEEFGLNIMDEIEKTSGPPSPV